MANKEKLTRLIPSQFAGQRLDQALSQMFDQFSRARLQQWIKSGHVQVDGKSMRPRDKVFGNESVELTVELEPEVAWQAEDIPLDIVYEDDDILVINKSAGMVVHPAAGHARGTVCNGLLYHVTDANTLPRAGVVHRLDKDTTGLMVVAKTLPAHTALVVAMQSRQIKREYLALVNGVMSGGGRVDAPIGRHPVDRKRMAVTANGKPAITHYRIKQRFSAFTLLDVRLETGRTHQIRVHMAHIHCPIVGDPTYGGRLRLPGQCSEKLRQQLTIFRRQALHAVKLSLLHPLNQQPLSWQTPVPADFQSLLDTLEPGSEHGK